MQISNNKLAELNEPGWVRSCIIWLKKVTTAEIFLNSMQKFKSAANANLFDLGKLEQFSMPSF